ncbi:MAG: EAL domain-containing protein [Burkholderiales bacterium]
MSPADPAAPDACPVTTPAAAELPFLERLRGCVEQRRADGQNMALLLVDYGVIGRIDALWGYQVGDTVRARMAASLRAEVLRPDDFVGELGRDELACVLSVVEGPQLALLAAEKLRRTLNAPLWLGEAEIYASPSVGFALFPGTAADAGSLLQQARSACVAAADLPGRVAPYDAERQSPASPLIEEGRLRSAIAEDALDLVFQPQFDLHFGQIMGVEAMLRWRDGSRDLVSMRDAIAAAEAGGLVTKLISALLNRALRNCSEFRQRAGLDLRIAINFPARALLEPELPDLVERALRTWSLRPGRLMLEIGDIASLQQHAPARAALLRLHAIGVKLSIDDARAPLSSLFLLALLPFHELKIDLSIARDWSVQTRSEGVLRSLIELVHQLKLDVVAVAAVDEAQAARLLALGCDFLQADFKAPFVDAEEFVERYAAQ